MLYSSFAQPTVSTSADTAGTTANITYNGVSGNRVLFVWGAGGAQVATAAQGIKMYALLTGTGMPGVVANLPISSWRSAYLATTSVGSVKGGPSVTPLEAIAPANGVVTVDVRNAASSTAPLAQVGICYGNEQLPMDWALSQDVWNLRQIPKTYITATPTSVTSTTELLIGTLTIPSDYPTICGVTTLGVTNGVRVTAEEFFGTCRYTATGVQPQGSQFEPSQTWPFFGQQDAPVGVDNAAESFLPEFWHPLTFKASGNSTVQSLITLRTAITNATSFQVFAGLR